MLICTYKQNPFTPTPIFQPVCIASSQQCTCSFHFLNLAHRNCRPSNSVLLVLMYVVCMYLADPSLDGTLSKLTVYC